MPQFTVKSNIRLDGKKYSKGSTIELTEEQAAEIPWAIEAEAPKEEEASEGGKKKKKSA